MSIAASGSSLGSIVTLTITSQPTGAAPYLFDGNTTATWKGAYTPTGGSPTAPFTVSFSASQIHAVSATQAQIILGDGTFTNRPNIEQLASPGTLDGQLILNFTGGLTHYQCTSFQVVGDAGSLRSVSYATLPTLAGSASVGAPIANIPLFVVSSLPSGTQIAESVLTSAVGHHVAAIVNVDSNTLTSSSAPPTISVSLVTFDSSGQEIDRRSSVILTKWGSTLVNGKISYVNNLLTPIIITDAALVHASYPNTLVIRGAAGGYVSIVP